MLFCLAVSVLHAENPDLVESIGRVRNFHVPIIEDADYYWWLDDELLDENTSEITLEFTESGEFELSAQYSVRGCLSPKSVILISVSDSDIDIPDIPDELPEIYPEKFFSPNGDGNNDTWDIINIQYYPNALIEIYDRFHKRLTQYQGIDKGWDGLYRGHPMPESDYWYIIKDKKLINTRSGHFILKR